MTHTVFISHSNKDQLDHEQYLSMLEHSGLSVILDKTFQRGEQWHFEIMAGLLKADAIVCYVTPHALESDWVLQEIGFGVSMDYFYPVGVQSVLDQLKRRAHAEDQRETILPRWDSILAYEFDLIPPGTTFEDHMKSGETVARLTSFVESRDEHQKEYRAKKLALLLNTDTLDEEFVHTEGLAAVLSMRGRIRREAGHSSLSQTADEESYANQHFREIRQMLEVLTLARYPGGLVEYRERDLTAEIAEHLAEGKRLISALGEGSDDTPPQLRFGADMALLHWAKVLVKRHILIHLSVGRGQFALAFNLMGENQVMTGQTADFMLRLFDDAKARLGEG